MKNIKKIIEKMKKTKNMDKQAYFLHYPLPDFEFDTITLAHGSGGLLTHQLLEKAVFKILGNAWLDMRHDGAVVSAKGRMAFTTDSFVISPIFFPGGDIGELAINGTINDVAMCGGLPEFLSLAFIIEEGFPVKDLWNIVISIKYAIDKAGVKIVTGDTKVVDKGKGDKIFINTTGLGGMHPSADIRLSRIHKGDKIIVSNSIGTHGIAILSVREGLQFETEIRSDTAPLHFMTRTLLDAFGTHIKLFRDPTRGGLAAVLNEIANATGYTLQLEEEKIPVLSQVRAACEILGLDPLYSANEGVFVAIVSPQIAEKAVETLHNFEEGRHAAVIGEITDKDQGIVLISNPLGGKRVMMMPVGEQLPRIC